MLLEWSSGLGFSLDEAQDREDWKRVVQEARVVAPVGSGNDNNSIPILLLTISCQPSNPKSFYNPFFS